MYRRTTYRLRELMGIMCRPVPEYHRPCRGPDRWKSGNRTPGDHSGPSGVVLYFPTVTAPFSSSSKVPRPSTNYYTPSCPRESRLKFDQTLLILLYSRSSINICPGAALWANSGDSDPDPGQNPIQNQERESRDNIRCTNARTAN